MAATLYAANPQTGLAAGTVPPTAAQAFYAQMLQAAVTFADADTTQLITHNWSLSAAEQAAYFPIASVFAVNVGTGTTALQLGVVQTSINAVSLTKLSTQAGSGVGWTFIVVLQRPASIIK